MADPSSRLKTGIASVVTTVWAISFLVDIIPRLDYEPSPFIHLAFMLILGALFGERLVRRNGNGEAP